MRASLKTLALLAGALLLAPSPAQAGAKPAREALKEAEEGRKSYNAVQNRFFLKSERFEVAPVLGYVPNNPFVKRYTGGALLAYHFSEVLAAEGAFLYAPDLGTNDLKDLTYTLVQIAEEGSGGVEFQQPLDKMILGATFAARWAPVYGKINLIGESVLNFDLYGTLGLGMLSINSYYATFSEDKYNQGLAPADIIQSEKKVKVPINIGIGMDFFLSSAIALKIDARNYLYIDKQPQYDPNQDPATLASRPYNDFIASVGLSVFLPSMQPRLYNF